MQDLSKIRKGPLWGGMAAVVCRSVSTAMTGQLEGRQVAHQRGLPNVPLQVRRRVGFGPVSVTAG